MDVPTIRQTARSCFEDIGVKFRVFKGIASKFSKKKAKDSETGKWSKPLKAAEGDALKWTAENGGTSNLMFGIYDFGDDDEVLDEGWYTV